MVFRDSRQVYQSLVKFNMVTATFKTSEKIPGLAENDINKPGSPTGTVFIPVFNEKDLLEKQFNNDSGENDNSQRSCLCSSSSWLGKHLQKANKWLGLFLAAGSGLLMTMYSALYKTIKKDIDNSTVLMLRGIIQVFIMAVILTITKGNIAPKNMESKSKLQKIMIWVFFICVCVFGGFRLCFLFSALEKIPMALVHTILNGSPVLVMMMSHFLLNDRCNPLRTLCTLALFVGVLLIFQPHALITHGSQISLNNTSANVTSLSNFTEDDCIGNNTDCDSKPDATDMSNDLLGYVFSVVALIFSACGSVLTKKIAQEFDKMVISMYLGITIGIIGWMQLIVFGPRAPTSPESAYVWFIAAVVGALGVGQQFCLIAALKLESPTRVTVIRSLNIVVSFVVQILAWNEQPGLDQICGALIVLSSIVVVTFEGPIMTKFRNFCCKNDNQVLSEEVVVDQVTVDKR